MDKKEINFFKKKLLEQKKELMQNADDTVEGMSVQKDAFPDPADRASYESERNFMLRIRDRENKLVKKIDLALKRIEDSVFGICELCGGEIQINRLKIRPVATKCINCKTKEEEIEKSIEK